MDINQLNRAYVEQYYIEQYEKDLMMNKKHKHCELIKAWADGAEIEFRYVLSNRREIVWSEWFTANLTPAWSEDYEFRIKPEPKPDVVSYFYATTDDISYTDESGANLKVTFDGETGELKSAEVLK